MNKILSFIFIKWFLILAAVCLMAVCALMFYASLFPIELVRSIFSRFAIDGSVDALSGRRFDSIVLRARLTSVLIPMFIAIVYLKRKRVESTIKSIITSLSSFLKEIFISLKAGIKDEERLHITVLALIIVIALVIRILFLSQPMRCDEAWTFTLFASKPLLIGLSVYSEPNNHLFHTLLVHVAYLIFGSSPWVIRLPALIAGLLVVPASYLFIRAVYNKNAAILTTSFVASSSILIEYSTNARGYTLICLFFVLLLSLVPYCKQDKNSGAWVLFVIISAVGFYTIPVMAYPFGVVFVWMLLSVILNVTSTQKRTAIKHLILSLFAIICITFLLYLPVIIVSGINSVTSNQYVNPMSFGELIRSFPHSLVAVWKQWNRDIPAIIKWVLIGGFFCSLIFHKRLSKHRFPVLISAIIAIPTLLLSQRVVPYARVWLFLLPLYVGLCCVGITFGLKLKRIGLARYDSVLVSALSLVLCLWMSWNVFDAKSVLYSKETGTLMDAEEISKFLKEYLNAGDSVVAVTPSGWPLTYYFNIHKIPYEYLNTDPNKAERIVVVVNKRIHTFKETLNIGELRLRDNINKKVIKRYESAELIEIKRLGEKEHGNAR